MKPSAGQDTNVFEWFINFNKDFIILHHDVTLPHKAAVWPKAEADVAHLSGLLLAEFLLVLCRSFLASSYSFSVVPFGTEASLLLSLSHS